MEIVKQCLSIDPEQRPSASELLEKPDIWNNFMDEQSETFYDVSYA